MDAGLDLETVIADPRRIMAGDAEAEGTDLPTVPDGGAVAESLREELKGWGFLPRQPLERAVAHELAEAGDQLLTRTADGDEYVLAESTYYGQDTDPHRPFLAVVLDALRYTARAAQR